MKTFLCWVFALGLIVVASLILWSHGAQASEESDAIDRQTRAYQDEQSYQADRESMQRTVDSFRRSLDND